MTIDDSLKNTFSKKLADTNSDVPNNRNLFDENEYLDFNYTPKPQPDFPILEIIIVRDTKECQEIKIYYGSKIKKRLLFTNFLPKIFASNYITKPSLAIRTAHLQDLVDNSREKS